MNRLLATFTSDEVNRYGYRIAVQALAAAVAQTWAGTPMFVSHDFHRPLGISRPMGLQMHATRALLRGELWLPSTPEEETEVERFARVFLAERLSDVDPADRNVLFAQLEGLASPQAEVLRRECVTVIDPGIAKRKFPALFPTDETDKRSLVPIRDLDVVAPGVFRVGELAVFAHRYFRRSLSQINNTNDAFLRNLFDLAADGNVAIKIALDPDSIGLASTYMTPVELEYWHGPKFDDELASIPAGVTVHKATERERIFYRIDRTEFFWHLQNGKRSFECEELLDSETLGIGGDHFGCRYAHSIIDETTRLPNHLDGAIRTYDAESYLTRIDTDIADAGKRSRYVKLWRVDGPISLETWKGLVSDFFRGNPLIGEYLGGIPESAAPEQRQGDLGDAQGKLMPSTLSEGGGLQIAVTYHRAGEFVSAPAGGYVHGTVYSTSVGLITTVELSAIDLLKVCQRRMGSHLSFNPDIVYVAIEDMDINHPLVLFRGHASPAKANHWKSALNDLCTAFGDRSERRFITATVAIEYGEAVVKFSFAGFADAIATALGELADFPESIEDVGPWCVSSYEYLKQNFAHSTLTSDANELFRVDGSFRVDRPYLPPGSCFIDEAGVVSVRLPLQEGSVAQALHAGTVSAVTSVRVSECACSTCGGSYIACACAALFDEGVAVTCEKVHGLRFALTERPAREAR